MSGQLAGRIGLGGQEAMLGGVIFDMDGVLIDSHPVHKAAWRELLRLLNRTVSESELDFVLDGAKREEILKHFLGDLEPVQLSTYGRIKEELFRDRLDHISTVPGVEAFLEELHQAEIPLAVATSAARLRTQNMLNHLGLVQRFSAIVTGDDVPNGKPDPRLFQKAAHSLSVDPTAIVVIEDAVSGVRAAKAAGMKSIGVANGPRAQELLNAGAALVIRDFRGLQVSTLGELFSVRP